MSGIGFGLERIGLVALRWPKAAGVAIAIALALLLASTPDLEFEPDFNRTFEAPRAAVATTSGTGALSDNVTVLIDADLRDRETMEALRLFQLELLLNEEVAAIFSIFSLQRPNSAATAWEPYFPDGADPEARIEELRRAPGTRAVLARLLSEDAGTTAMAVVPARLAEGHVDSDRLTEIVAATIADYRGRDIRFEIAGRAAIVKAIISAIRRDHVVITLLGVAIGIVCGMLVFRSLPFAILAVLPGTAALAGMFGFMANIGYKVTVLTSAVTALVLVLAVADTMHTCIDWLKRRERGEGPAEALRGSVLTVGPACALTSLTTIAAFLSMAIVDSPGIRDLSIIGAFGCGFAFLAVITVFPLAALAWSAAGFRPPAWRGFPVITGRRWFRPLPLRTSTAVVAAATVVALAALYLQTHLVPRFNLLSSVPRDAPIQAATARADRAFGGLTPVSIRLDAPAGTDFRESATWESLERAAAIAKEVAGESRVLGLPTLIGDADPAARQRLLDPVLAADGPAISAALMTPDARTAYLTVFVETGRSYDEILQLADRLLAEVSPNAAPLGVRVGGAAVLTARESDRVIRALHRNLLLATACTIFVIGAGFRSVRYGVAALLPNALPILLVGAWLAVSGVGLQFSTAIALIIAFGIAVDDTIHFLSRFRHNLAAGGRRDAAVDRTFHDIAIVLMATTFLLCAGLSTTLTSAIPALREYGYLSIATLVLALACLLVILPALIHRVFPKTGPG